jgi:hypothetical protein
VLRPFSTFDFEWLRQFGTNKILRAQVKEPRKLDRHRLYWAVLREVVDSTGTAYSTPEGLHKTLLLACGVVEPVRDLTNDSIVMIPSSTSFETMDEGEFSRYLDSAFQLITTHICPGVSIKELLKQAEEKCGQRKLSLAA